MMYRGRGAFGPGIDEADKVPPERRWPTVRRIAGFFKPYRPAVAVVLAAILLISLIGIVNPILLKLLIDDAIPNQDFAKLNLYVGLMIALPIVSGLIGIGQTYLNNLIGQNVMADLRNALYEHLQKMPLRFFTDTKTGEIQSRLSNDVGGIQGVVTETATNVVANLTTAITTIIAMFIISWPLTVLSLGLLPFFMYLTYRVGRVRRQVSTATQESLSEMTAATQETLSVSGALLTKTFGRQQTSIDRFRDINLRLARLQLKQVMVGRWFFMIVGVVFSITPAFVYWLAGYLTIQDAATAPTIGDIVAFTTLQSRLFFPLGALLGVGVEIAGALALFDRIFGYLDLVPDIVDAPDAIDLDRRTVKGRIRFDGVGFTYARAGGRRPDPMPARPPGPTADGLGTSIPFALEDISFEAEPGSLVALVGPSGSGKTTTTYLIPRLYDATAGIVEIDGTDVRRIRLDALGRFIGVVTQETYLFHASVRENLLFAKPDATQEELEAASKAAAIHERILEFPDGYDTVVGERGYKLSGGEKQRIAIARVLLKDPRILILDEATSSLDTVSERLIQAALERLEAGRTTVAIAHRLSTILRADQILVYERGRIVERGTHSELLARDGLYAQLYREQFLAPVPAAPDGDGSTESGLGGQGEEALEASPRPAEALGT
jgi:ATP-binding cassette subfamily B protein